MRVLLASVFGIVRLARNPLRGLTRPLVAVLVVFLAALFSAGLLGSYRPARADQLSSLQQEAAQAVAQLNSLSQQIDQADQQYLTAQQKLASLAQQITSTRAELASLQAQQQKEEQILRQDAIAAYIEAGSGGEAIDILSSSSEVATLKAQYLRTASQEVSSALQQLLLTRDQLKQSEQSLSQAYEQQQQNLELIAQKRNQLEQEAAQEQSLVASLKGQIGQLVAQIQAQQAQQRAQAAAQLLGAKVAAAAPKVPVAASVVNVPPVSGSVSIVVQTALSYLGDPYAWGGMSHSGVDCSGLAVLAWAAVGVSLPRTAQEQYDATAHVPLDPSAWQPGDLIFYGSSTSDITHVAIYLGNGTVVQAANYQYGVVETSVYWAGTPVGVGRP